jgi:hypothetical protein
MKVFFHSVFLLNYRNIVIKKYISPGLGLYQCQQVCRSKSGKMIRAGPDLQAKGCCVSAHMRTVTRLLFCSGQLSSVESEARLVHSPHSTSWEPQCSLLANSLENQDKMLEVMLSEIDVK